MPSLNSVYRKLDSDESFLAAFRARKAVGVRAIVDDCLEIADEPVKELLDVADKRVRIDTRLRLAGKWLSAEFGDKVDVTHKHDVEAQLETVRAITTALSAMTKRLPGDGAKVIEGISKEADGGDIDG